MSPTNVHQQAEPSTLEQQKADTRKVLVKIPQTKGGVTNKESKIAKISIERTVTEIIAPQVEIN